MEIKTAHSPKWANPEHSAILLNVDFKGIGNLPFLAAPDDPEMHGKELFSLATAGQFGPVGEYVDTVEPTLSDAQTRSGKIAEMARIEAELGMTRVMRESMLMILPDCYQRTKIQEAEDRIAAIRATL